MYWHWWYHHVDVVQNTSQLHKHNHTNVYTQYVCVCVCVCVSTYKDMGSNKNEDSKKFVKWLVVDAFVLTTGKTTLNSNAHTTTDQWVDR